MGKGDIKSKKGKVWKGTYGVRRKRKATKQKGNIVAKATLGGK